MTKTPASGKVGIFAVGMGAVASTFFAGVEFVRKGLRPAVGSFVELGFLQDGQGTEVPVRNALPIADLAALEFGGVDLVETDALRSAVAARVLSEQDLSVVSGFLSGIAAGPGIHDPTYIRNLKAPRARAETAKADQAAAMSSVYREFLSSRGADRGVVLLTLSTEEWRPLTEVHATPGAFRAGLGRDDPSISPSQIYAWAALDAGLPVVNCTPNQVVDVPAIRAFAEERGVPIAGSDLKSGQTLMKTVIAAGLAQRFLGVRGWFSTNILGNRDGFVLDEPANFRAKEITKGSVLADILDAGKHPDLYGDLVHQVHINYFPPKGDNKESWDAIQLSGWMGYEMELKVNFQCRDSVLAAPLVLDLALLADLAARNGGRGVQPWLGGYFKSPATLPGRRASNDLHLQMAELRRHLGGWVGKG